MSTQKDVCKNASGRHNANALLTTAKEKAR
jgi:hypothetical protein